MTSRDYIVGSKTSTMDRGDHMLVLQIRIFALTVGTGMIELFKNIFPFRISQCSWEILYTASTGFLIMVSLFRISSSPVALILAQALPVLLVVSTVIFLLPFLSTVGLAPFSILLLDPFRIALSILAAMQCVGSSQFRGFSPSRCFITRSTHAGLTKQSFSLATRANASNAFSSHNGLLWLDTIRGRSIPKMKGIVK